MSKMKLLNEILDLHKLHQNPQELDKYKESQAAVNQKGRWVALLCRYDGYVCIHGNSTLSDMAQMLDLDDAGNWVDPFDLNTFKLELSKLDRIEIADAEFTKQHGVEDNGASAQYQKSRLEFSRTVARITPSTLITVEDDSMQSGLIVTEHNTNITKLVLSKADDQPEYDE